MKPKTFVRKEKDGTYRYMGALATEAYLDCANPRDAMVAFERITGKKVHVEGCNCCGEPHSFGWRTDDKTPKSYYDCDTTVYGRGCLNYLFPDQHIPDDIRDLFE